MKKTILISFLTLLASSIFAQTKIGHVWYEDKGNEVYYGNQILFRTDHTNIDTLTSITWGSIAYDTVNQVVVVYDGSSWVDLVSGSNNTLDDAYDEGGSGAGRLITADNGAVQIDGPFLVLDTIGQEPSAVISANSGDLSVGVISNDINSKNEIIFSITGVAAKLDYPSSVFSVQDSLNNVIFSVSRDSNTVINGSLKYVDGNQGVYKYLTSDANGNASWQHTFAYGEMGFGDSSSTIALTQNTPAWVTNGNNDLWSEGAATLSDVTYSNDSIICNADGIYEVNIRLSGDLALNDVLKLGIYKNGTLSCTCQGQITSPVGGTVEITYLDIISLSTDDALQVYITNTANDNDFDAISAKMIIHKVGN